MSNYVLPAQDSHLITPDEAIAMIGLYRNTRDQILKPEYCGQNILCDSETFNAADVQVLLSQPGCNGLRIYYGMKTGLTVHAILVGTDANGNDLAAANNVTAAGDVILEEGKRCPPQCPAFSILNT
ncbi:MAG TPA: hypothetical protein VHP12_09900 [Chitinophagaceae bacterium]|nr:hypothetical protein [Chitinophagaceae bacterium]